MTDYTKDFQKFFESQLGRVNSWTAWQAIMSGIAYALANNVHPHRFRRTGATMALRAGMPLMEVSKLLGHESIETTQIYLDISDEELEQAHMKYVI